MSGWTELLGWAAATRPGLEGGSGPAVPAVPGAALPPAERPGQSWVLRGGAHARRGPPRVRRSDTTGGAQVSSGSLLPGALALPAWELSARVNTGRGVRGVSTERQSRGGAGAPPAKPGRGCGAQISLPWRGRPPPPARPQPSPRTGGAGAGRRRGVQSDTQVGN